MIFSKFGLPTLAAVSAMLAIAEGREAFTALTSKPLIDGIGVYAETVTAGETVPVYWDIQKDTDCDGVTSRVWSSEGFFWAEPQQSTALPMGAWSGEIQTEIPVLAPTGSLELTIKGYFECPGEARSYFSLPPVEFEVTG